MDSFEQSSVSDMIISIRKFQKSIKNEIVSECRNIEDLRQLSNKITALGGFMLIQIAELDSDDLSKALLPELPEEERDKDAASVVIRTLGALLELGISQANLMLAEQSLDWADSE